MQQTQIKEYKLYCNWFKIKQNIHWITFFICTSVSICCFLFQTITDIILLHISKVTILAAMAIFNTIFHPVFSMTIFSMTIF